MAISILVLAALGLIVGSVVAVSRPSSGMLRVQARPSATTSGSPNPSASVAPVPATGSAASDTVAATTGSPSAAVTTLPSNEVTATTGPTPSTSPAAKKKAQRRSSITYTVKRGDTLSGIAEWFKQHGYRDLYATNRTVIGSNPDLIRPGERITISHGVMTLKNPT